MFRSRSVLALGVLASCNTVFELDPTVAVDADVSDAAPPAPDRDRDGIFDFEDACIAGIAEPLFDIDGDGEPSGSDACPLDAFAQTSGDTDADTIPDACDPEPVHAGDRARCLHLFLNPSINLELWTPRPGDEAAWVLYDFPGLRAAGTGTVVAGDSFEAPQVTHYDLRLRVEAPATTSSVTLWLRTNLAAASADVGCRVGGGAQTTALELLGAAAEPVPPVMQTFGGAVRLTATVVRGPAGATNVRCKAVVGAGATLIVSGSAALPDGTVGLGVSGVLEAEVEGLMVFERDDNRL